MNNMAIRMYDPNFYTEIEELFNRVEDLENRNDEVNKMTEEENVIIAKIRMLMLQRLEDSLKDERVSDAQCYVDMLNTDI